MRGGNNAPVCVRELGALGKILFFCEKLPKAVKPTPVASPRRAPFAAALWHLRCCECRTSPRRAGNFTSTGRSVRRSSAARRCSWASRSSSAGLLSDGRALRLRQRRRRGRRRCLPRPFL
eukprot:5959052-Prymnesium_polylepis.1